MPVRITCPSCKKSYSVDDSLRGKKVRCHACEQPMVIPSARPASAQEMAVSDRKLPPAPRPAARRAEDDSAGNGQRLAKAARRQRDEDDEEDRPRRNGKKKPTKSSLPLLLIGGGIGAVVAGVVGVLVYVLVSGKKDDAVAQAKQPPGFVGGDPARNPQAQPQFQPQPQVPQKQPQPAQQPQPQQVQPPQPVQQPQQQPKQQPPQPVQQPQLQPKQQPPQPRPVERQPQPVAGPVDLDKDVEIKITRATALVRVDLGNQSSSGSGFLVKSSGDTAYIITNFHVIALENDGPAQPQSSKGPRFKGPRFGGPGMAFLTGPGARKGKGKGPKGRFGPGGKSGQPRARPQERPRAVVILHSGTPQEQTLTAEVVAVDPERDLAALRVTGARNLPEALDVSQEAAVAETQPVYIFGFPGDPARLQPGNPPITVGKGTIAGLRRDANNELIDVHINGIINPGNSGGPVVDAQGHLVGIAVATVPGKQIGFAIPASELQQMFKGRLAAGVVLQLKQQGTQLYAVGETWVHDHKSSVRAREVVAAAVGNVPRGQRVPPNEFLLLGVLADPMLKVRGVSAYFAMTENVPAQPDATGWPKLANAMAVPLTMQDQRALGSFKLPAGAVLDNTYAFQFSFVNADGKTVFTQPHLVRLTFPKNTKSVTIQVSDIPDEPTARYIEDTAPGAFGAKVKVKSKSGNSLVFEVDPVPDTKVIAPQIKFGTVTSVQGRTFQVKARKIDLPLPSDADVASALADLKGPDNRLYIAAADKLAKAYVPLPARRAEVAKALEAHVSSNNMWLVKAALRGLMVWGSPDNIPAISIAAANNWTRGEALHCLAKYKTAASAEALAKYLPGLGDRAFVSAALKSMGPLAEKAVIPYLKHKDGWTVQEACRILHVIGTAECIPMLTEVANSNNSFVNGHARTALQSVRARTKGSS